jgi:hypothetical protein
MTQQLKSYAYELEQDIDHLEGKDVKYDIEIEVDESNESQVEHVLSIRPDELEVLDIPNPLRCWAEMSRTIYTDYPYCDYLSGSIMSKRMLEVLLSVKSFGHLVYPVELIDWELTPPRGFTVPNNYDYILIQLTEYTTVFDYEKSVYSKRKYTVPRYNKNGEEEWFVSNVEEFSFTVPQNGLPPIFRVEESPVRLFVSDEARQALKESKITGIKYLALQGLAYEEIRTEVDVPIDYPNNMDIRNEVLRKKLGL